MAGPVPKHAAITWNAPAPFPSLVGASHKALMNNGAQIDRIGEVLESLSQSGKTTGAGECMSMKISLVPPSWLGQVISE